MSDCIFCKIVKKEIPTEFLYEDDQVVAFNDINPQAPVHILVIPKKHYPTLNDIPEGELDVLSSVYNVARKLAKEKGVAESGYRTIVNTNRESGQVVFHVHFHVIGGRPLGPLA